MTASRAHRAGQQVKAAADATLGLLAVGMLRAIRATSPGGVTFPAYEIHMGVTAHRSPLAPFARLADGSPDGARGERVLGTYLHGALEDGDVCSHLFGIEVAAALSKVEQYSALADWFERYADPPEQWLSS